MCSYNVLIADDDATVRKLIGRICLDLGWTVGHAANGGEALELMQSQPYQIFVVDVKMPGPAGIELARKIMEYEKAPAILILTGYAEVKQAVQAMKEGVFDYVQKDVVNINYIKNLLLNAANFHEGRLRSICAQREREKAIKDLDASNKQFQAVLELSSDMIFILNARTGQFVDCNATAYDQLGYTRQELLALTPSDIDLNAEPGWEQVLKSNSLPHTLTESTFKRRDGSTFPVEMSLAYVSIDTGEFIAAVIRDITERKRAQEINEQAKLKSEAEAATLRTLIEGMEAGILVTDEHDVVTEVNSWFLNMSRIPKEFIAGQDLSRILYNICELKCSDILADFRSNVSKQKVNLQGILSENKVMFSFQPIYSNDNYRGTILNVIDVTDLMNSAEKAEESNRLKNELVEKISSEIHTPLEGILSMNDLVLSSNLNEDQRVILQMIKECGLSIENLISDLKDLSKVESGTLEYESNDFQLRGLLQNIIDEVRPRTSKRGVQIELQVDHQIPDQLNGHEESIKQICTVLIEDALKFLSGEKLSFDVKEDKLYDNNVRLLCVVSTSSLSMNDDVTVSNYPGLDVRSSLIQNLVDALQGNLWVEKVRDKPQRFCFRTMLKQSSLDTPVVE